MDAFAWVCLGWALFASLVALVALGSFLQKQKELTAVNLLNERLARLEKTVGGLLAAADDVA